MKINWKELAKSKGYKSLKAAMVSDIQRDINNAKRHGGKPFRDKHEFRRKFNWIIARAKHYAHHQNRTIESVLDEWEEKRSYWWLNFYQGNNMPRLDWKPQHELPSTKAVIRYYRKDRWTGHKNNRYLQNKLIMGRVQLDQVIKKKNAGKKKLKYKQLCVLR